METKFQKVKRFSAEGGEVQIAMLDAFLELGGALGVKEVVFGMAHRGRLNVLTNILRQAGRRDLLARSTGPTDPKQYLNRHDVKYHMGYSRDHTTRAGNKVHLTMAFNPSHLGFVHPVVEGRVRAKQDRAGGGHAAKKAIVPLVIHGDAAFAGQGLIAETLNLSGLEGYDTGGTIHLVINNQLGYTTDAKDGRSSVYCTGQAAMLDIPIFHVNGDDPEACVHVMRVATEFRQKLQHRRGDRPRLLPQVRPQRGRRARASRSPRCTSCITRAARPCARCTREELATKGRISAEDSQACTRKSQRSTPPRSSSRSKQSLGEGSRAPAGRLVEVPRRRRQGRLRRSRPASPRARSRSCSSRWRRLPEGFVLHNERAEGRDRQAAEDAARRGADRLGHRRDLAYATLLTAG